MAEQKTLAVVDRSSLMVVVEEDLPSVEEEEEEPQILAEMAEGARQREKWMEVEQGDSMAGLLHYLPLVEQGACSRASGAVHSSEVDAN